MQHICIGEVSASFSDICIYDEVLVKLLLATAIFVSIMMCIYIRCIYMYNNVYICIGIALLKKNLPPSVEYKN